MRRTTDEITRTLCEEGLDSQNQDQVPHPARPLERHTTRRRPDLEHLVGCVLVLLGAGAAAASFVAALRRVGLRAGLVTGVVTGKVTAALADARKVGHDAEHSDAPETTDGNKERQQIRRLTRRIGPGVQPIRGSPPHRNTRR